MTELNHIVNCMEDGKVPCQHDTVSKHMNL